VGGPSNKSGPNNETGGDGAVQAYLMMGLMVVASSSRIGDEVVEFSEAEWLRIFTRSTIGPSPNLIILSIHPSAVSVSGGPNKLTPALNIRLINTKQR
jgi:hypothetical protein